MVTIYLLECASNIDCAAPAITEPGVEAVVWEEATQSLRCKSSGVRIAKTALRERWIICCGECTSPSAVDTAHYIGLSVAAILPRHASSKEPVSALNAELWVALGQGPLAPWASDDRREPIGTENLADLCRLLVDISPTQRVWLLVEGIVSTPYNSGIQRLARSLAKGLQDAGVDVTPVAWNHEKSDFRPVSTPECAHIKKWNGPDFPTHDALPDADGSWLLVPELLLAPGPTFGQIENAARRRKLKIGAIFFDLIPLKLSPRWRARRDPPIYSEAVAKTYEDYWKELARADAILPISHAACNDLVNFLQSALNKLVGLDQRIIPVPLAGEFPGHPRIVEARDVTDVRPSFRILSVGTIEPRKNYRRLIEGYAQAASSAPAQQMELTIVGSHIPHPDYASEIRAAAETANQAGHCVRLLDNVSDTQLSELYAEADIVAYASCEEGFGLPILESNWFGKACICHHDGAIKETANAGGALQIDMRDIAQISGAMTRVANDPNLLTALTSQALERPIKRWKDYALEICRALHQLGGPAPASPRAREPALSAPSRSNTPLLSICITTFNRAEWLSLTLPRLLEFAKPYASSIEVVVCDNASTDDTPAVVETLRERYDFTSARQPQNVGMIGNLGASVEHATGEFVWLIGDDDVLVAGALEDLVEALLDHPHIDMAYLNYATSDRGDVAALSNLDDLVERSIESVPRNSSRYVERLREVACATENLFTGIYTCVFRRHHALRAYGYADAENPFHFLNACVPSAVYALETLLDRPAYWLGNPAVVANLNVSWGSARLRWHLQRLPELFDLAEKMGLASARLDSYRWTNARSADALLEELFKSSHDRSFDFDANQFVAQHFHLRSFRETLLPRLRRLHSRHIASNTTAPDRESASDPFANFER